MLIKVDSPSADASTPFLTERQRIFATTRGLILSWRDRPHLLYELLFMTEAQFIQMMRQAEARQALSDGVGVEPNAVLSINAGFTDAQYGEVHAAICHYVRELGKKGAAWRRRKDSTI